VWTPAKSADEKLPVLVWIHGGGYFAGSGTERLHHGDNLAAKGVIVVSFNYRLGVFGFMAHPDLTKESPHHASGNYGLMDQAAAIAWVHRNIAAFGGDPNRVTIFGESAGGGSVNCMQATPLNKGMFQGVIAESGSAFSRYGFGGGSSKSLAEAEQAGVKFAQGMGASTIAELRAIPANRILVATKSVPFGVYAPVIDGYVLPEDTFAIFSEGKQNDVPVLVGSNSDEGTVLGPFVPKGLTPELQQEYDKLYLPGKTVNATSGATLWMMRTWARLEMKTGTHKAYEYYFSRAVPYPADQKFNLDTSHLGAHHGSEISYVFNNLDIRKARNWPWTKEDYALADMMSSYWVNFAKNGDPNGPGLPAWPLYNDSNPQVMHFDTKVEVMPLPRADEFDFWDKVQKAASVPAAWGK
jgi:para-nitrobenzyl esterase